MAKQFKDDDGFDAFVGLAIGVGAVALVGIAAYNTGFCAGKIDAINGCNKLMDDIVRDAGDVAIDAYKKALTENVPSVSDHLTALVANNPELLEQIRKSTSDEFWKNVDGWCVLPA